MSGDLTKPVDQTKLALERTYLAYERTLMAWVRTSTSLITFGFTLYKFFYFLRELDPTKYTAQILGARIYGLIMIGIGVLSLVSATFQHQLYLKKLRDQSIGDALFPRQLSSRLSIASLGILSFAVTAFRL